ncbi:MAG: ABC transporter permease [Candidatus Tectomicrobia bacterium]|uniref:ABC transporter permease n=1 Tax=Tectimicrobiota bacterium TaxID=2528274 RepID=A0A938B251_UNCTE|nr:ABC transporter permease [Candidatus Tectomicrobia bacterium]
MARRTSPVWAERDDSVPFVYFVLGQLGIGVLYLLSSLGRSGVFLGQTMGLLCMPPWKVRRILRQVQFIGARSLLVIALTGLFAGMVLGLQGYYTLTRFGSEAFLGPAVAISLITELGPVLSALMVTGRAGSAIAAEIGIMRITEQIDALEVMALHPIRYLVVPNIVAGVLTLPLLGALFSVIGIYGGYLVGVELLGVSSGTYFGSMADFVDITDVRNGFYKSLSFGVLITFLCCFKGYHTGYGAEGVSKATTEAVVSSSVAILVMDYLLNSVLL